MPEIRWEGSGPDFTLLWAGRLWTLKVGGPDPGLRSDGDFGTGCFLSLAALRAAGRFATNVFTPATLVACERHRDRVQATYAPPGWGGLTVRAAWGPAVGDKVDLEVQASATSLGELFGLEVEVSSDWMGLGGEPARALAWTVEPRDVRAAALSYDGREAPGVLRGLTTLPIPESSQNSARPIVIAAPAADDAELCYVEMVQPNDVARRVLIEPVMKFVSTRSLAVRYGLFGHDLEKGVVLRGRLRGCWIRSKVPVEAARHRYDEFLREPPALGP